MKKIVTLALLGLFLLCGCERGIPFIHEEKVYKPVIYFYPKAPIDISVKLDYPGSLLYTYPSYDQGWDFKALPSGELIKGDASYAYLFWEAKNVLTFDFSKAFCVKGSETVTFLEKALTTLGLNARERNDFITYYIPLMVDNPYNLIAFQDEAYQKHVKLTVTPKPDSVIRVFMAFKALNKPVKVTPQKLVSPKREGFSVVEWGGSQVYN